MSRTICLEAVGDFRPPPNIVRTFHKVRCIKCGKRFRYDYYYWNFHLERCNVPRWDPRVKITKQEIFVANKNLWRTASKPVAASASSSRKRLVDEGEKRPVAVKVETTKEAQSSKDNKIFPVANPSGEENGVRVRLQRNPKSKARAFFKSMKPRHQGTATIRESEPEVRSRSSSTIFGGEKKFGKLRLPLAGHKTKCPVAQSSKHNEISPAATANGEEKEVRVQPQRRSKIRARAFFKSLKTGSRGTITIRESGSEVHSRCSTSTIFGGVNEFGKLPLPLVRPMTARAQVRRNAKLTVKQNKSAGRETQAKKRVALVANTSGAENGVRVQLQRKSKTKARVLFKSLKPQPRRQGTTKIRESGSEVHSRYGSTICGAKYKSYKLRSQLARPNSTQAQVRESPVEACTALAGPSSGDGKGVRVQLQRKSKIKAIAFFLTLKPRRLGTATIRESGSRSEVHSRYGSALCGAKDKSYKLGSQLARPNSTQAQVRESQVAACTPLAGPSSGEGKVVRVQLQRNSKIKARAFFKSLKPGSRGTITIRESGPEVHSLCSNFTIFGGKLRLPLVQPMSTPTLAQVRRNVKLAVKQNISTGREKQAKTRNALVANPSEEKGVRVQLQRKSKNKARALFLSLHPRRRRGTRNL